MKDFLKQIKSSTRKIKDQVIALIEGIIFLGILSGICIFIYAVYKGAYVILPKVSVDVIIGILIAYSVILFSRLFLGNNTREIKKLLEEQNETLERQNKILATQSNSGIYTLEDIIKEIKNLGEEIRGLRDYYNLTDEMKEIYERLKNEDVKKVHDTPKFWLSEEEIEYSYDEDFYRIVSEKLKNLYTILSNKPEEGKDLKDLSMILLSKEEMEKLTNFEYRFIDEFKRPFNKKIAVLYQGLRENKKLNQDSFLLSIKEIYDYLDPTTNSIINEKLKNIYTYFPLYGYKESFTATDIVNIMKIDKEQE